MRQILIRNTVFVHTVISAVREITVAVRRLGLGNNNQMALTSSQALGYENLFINQYQTQYIKFLDQKYRFITVNIYNR